MFLSYLYDACCVSGVTRWTLAGVAVSWCLC